MKRVLYKVITIIAVANIVYGSWILIDAIIYNVVTNNWLSLGDTEKVIPRFAFSVLVAIITICFSLLLKKYRPGLRNIALILSLPLPFFFTVGIILMVIGFAVSG